LIFWKPYIFFFSNVVLKVLPTAFAVYVKKLKTQKETLPPNFCKKIFLQPTFDYFFSGSKTKKYEIGQNTVLKEIMVCLFPKTSNLWFEAKHQ